MFTATEEASPTILVVEDELFVRTVVRDTLTSCGFTVVEAENGQVALDIIGEVAPDLVLLDIVMPHVDGIEFCRQLRQRPASADIPVLVMTSLEDRKSIQEAYDAGATDITSKPINDTAIGHRIRYLLRAQEYLVQLRQERNLVSTVLETTKAIVVVLDVRGHVVRVNKACEQIGGYSEEELIGRSFLDVFFDEDDKQVLLNVMQDLINCGGGCHHETQLIAKDGKRKTISWSCNRMTNGDALNPCIVASGIDVTERRRAEEQIFKLGNFDSLTGLPNRCLFSDRLEQACKNANRHNFSVAVLSIGIDRFKRVNDSFDHTQGDDLLTQIGQRLGACLRGTDSVFKLESEEIDSSLSRLGGDEFNILLAETSNIQDSAKVAQRILSSINKPFLLPNGQEVALTASIGISSFPSDGSAVNELLRFANVAMSHVKANGGNSYQYYAKEMNTTALQKIQLENEFIQGLQNGEFELHYQPQVDLSDNRIVSVEALARWQHPQKGMISPGLFIPIASETGLIDNLVDWTLETACQQIKKWQSSGIYDLRVAINIPSRNFLQDDLPSKLQTLLASHDLEGHSLELEITEDSIMSQEEKCIQSLANLKKLGIQLSIDDFGTGYSSLSYLSRFQLDTLKVDRSFLKGVPENENSCTLIRAIISMAHRLGLKVVAEGVETAAQLEFIRSTNCELVQGYYFSKPLPEKELEALIKAKPNF